MSIYLKSLEISGFKSFGSRTYIEFSEGITGVVGPNGCGKSNVIESMKWVLGEQSARSLRGEKMQDIIFAGTKHRSASGMADVTLTFNNELQWLPLEFPEVSVGRRIFRSGEGQYFVNGIRSRLKDTTELFLDTGVGRDSYAIFEQGKIDRLLSESAEDRRILFEDFAGISKFKFRKEEAEKKLAQARENLERLQETLDRLEKTIEILEIQAKDAENYNQINNELREMEIKFEVARVGNMRTEIARREQEITKLIENLEPMSEKLNDMENQIGLTDEALGEKEKLFGQMNEKYIKLEKELTEAKIRHQSAKKNHEENSKRLEELKIRSRQDSERIEEWEETIQEKQDSFNDAQKKQKTALSVLNESEEKQNKIKQEIEKLENNLLIQSQELGFSKSLSRDDLDQLIKKNAELQGRMFVQESEILRLEEEINSKIRFLSQEENALKDLQAKFLSSTDKKNIITEQKNTLITKIKTIEQEISYLEQEQKNILDCSKACDSKILKAMDQQIEDLKTFNRGEEDRKKQLKTILSKIESIVHEEKFLDQETFKELQQTLQNNEEAYKMLLEKIFGKDGLFTEKIELSEKIDVISKQLQEKRKLISEIRKEIETITEEETIIFRELTENESLYKASEREFQKTDKSISVLNEQLSKAQINFIQLRKEIELNIEKQEKMKLTVNDYDRQLNELRQKNSNLQEELTHARINFNSTETQTRALKNDIKSLEERREDLQRQINNFESDRSSLIKTLKNLEEEMEDLLSDQDELNPELARLKEAITQNTSDITDLRHSKKVIEQMHKDGLEQYTKLQMREREIEGSLAERRDTLEAMISNFQEQFKMPLDSITMEEHENVEHLNNSIRRYREQLNQLGSVNLLAIEQFQSTKEEYATLLFQKEDIEAAAYDTEVLINDTNKESADRFLSAFEKIRHSFQKLFSELFDGGRADLILKDKTDPLKSGIDIMAEPPGQKFQNVSLLSGGQRAMVAIAVIFSILELKPTPFVILDEMDAPLDDENIDRFKRLLVRFKGTSQFVVVSHSKSTLEVCDVLFGVTMEELGCSKVVSVAFDETENLLFAE